MLVHITGTITNEPKLLISETGVFRAQFKIIDGYHSNRIQTYDMYLIGVSLKLEKGSRHEIEGKLNVNLYKEKEKSKLNISCIPSSIDSFNKNNNPYMQYSVYKFAIDNYYQECVVSKASLDFLKSKFKEIKDKLCKYFFLIIIDYANFYRLNPKEGDVQFQTSVIKKTAEKIKRSRDEDLEKSYKEVV